MFAYDSKFSTFTRKIGKYLLINAFLLICSIPIFTMGTAISAAYYTLLENLVRDRGYLGGTFFGAFKRNYKQGALMGLICLPVIALLIFDIYYFFNSLQAGYGYGYLYILFAILLVIMILLALYIFAYLARFTDNIRTIIRNSVLIMLSNPWPNIKLLLVILVVVFGIYLVPWLVLIFPVILLRFSVTIIEKVFMKYMRKEDLEQEQDKDKVNTD